jgi:hypothetical protein
MSRSYRKTPVIGNAICRSEKKYKQFYNREKRRPEKNIDSNSDDFYIARPRNGNYIFGKDGKGMFKVLIITFIRRNRKINLFRRHPDAYIDCKMEMFK